MADDPQSPDRFTRLAIDAVGAAQRKLPPEIRALARHVPVHYQTRPPADVLAEGFEPDILGLFSGNPHGTELAHDNPSPPQIVLYLENLREFAEGDPDVFCDEVRITYLHELGHYLGWGEDEVAAHGLD